MLPDPASSFLINKAIAGARNISAVADVRLPITPAILYKLIQATQHCFTSAYKALMMRAMMVLAFKAFLRVGEMAPRCKSNSKDCLQYSDIIIASGTITVYFKRFKHSTNRGPQTLTIKGDLIDGTHINPIGVMQEFVHNRGSIQAALFCFPDGSPIIRRYFDNYLKSLLGFCGLDSTHFKGHSFRIGAATAAAMRGDSYAQIRASGRWASDAFRRYIRIA